DGVDLLVDGHAHRLAELYPPAVLRDALLLLLEAAESETEPAEPAVCAVDLGAGAGDRDPHRRVRLLVWLRQDCARRHPKGGAVVAEALLSPHFRQAAHDLIPGLLRVVRVRAECAALGPGGGAPGTHFKPAPRDDVECSGALGDADRVVDLRHA